MEILEACPIELKLVILSKLPPGLLRSLNLDSKYSEVMYKYSAPMTYEIIKKVIVSNKKYGFYDYTEEGPYMWKQLLQDNLLYYENYPGDSDFWVVLYNYELMRGELHEISLVMLSMIVLYKVPDVGYEPVKEFTQIPIGPYLLLKAIVRMKKFDDIDKSGESASGKINVYELFLDTPLILMYKTKELNRDLYDDIRFFYDKLVKGIDDDDDEEYDDDPAIPIYTYNVYRKLYDYAYNKMLEDISSDKIRLLA